MKFDERFIPLILDGSKFLTLRRSIHEEDFYINDILFHSKVVDCFNSLYFKEIGMSYIQNFGAYGFSNFSDMNSYYENYLKKYPIQSHDLLYLHRLFKD